MVEDLSVAPRPQAPVYIVSFFNPIIGLVIGSTWMGKSGDDNRVFGKYCLLSAAGGVAVFLSAFIGVLFYTVAAFYRLI